MNHIARLELSKEVQLNLLLSMYRIRRIEEVLADEYRKGTMRTPTHFGIGQEAVAVGVCNALQLDDVVFSHHRSHTHYLAKGGNLFGLIAELLGREGGCSKGRGGSVHLIDLDAGFMGSSPILGHSLALAAGSALAMKMDGKKNISVAFFGEGACDEGAVWETLNFASIRKLPVLFVCENNLYATESPLSVRQPAGTSLCERASAFKIHSKRIDGNDVVKVLNETVQALKLCNSDEGPVFLECMTYRWREHVGPLWDYEAGRTYRSKEELEEWMRRCPIQKLENEIVSLGLVSAEDLQFQKNEVNKEIARELELAYLSPWPNSSGLLDNVY